MSQRQQLKLATSKTRVTIVLQRRFEKTPDGSVWTTGPFSNTFWQRYLDVFERVTIVARVINVATKSPGALIVNCGRVTVHAVTHYLGPKQFLFNYQQIYADLRLALVEDTAVILRLPSSLGAMAVSILQRKRRHFAVELVGDPYDVFAPGGVNHVLRPLIRLFSLQRTRQCVATADAVAYVTQFALQRRYPPSARAYHTHYSSIELPSTAIAERARIYSTSPTCLKLITVGSLEQNYKGTDVLLKAIAIAKKAGFNVHLTVVGGGKTQGRLEHLTTSLGIGDDVTFLGQLPSGASVRNQLDAADIFVLPSRAEGLPRAMIEAMARALPCIGTDVGGIPELLPPDVLVPPDNARRLAESIMSLGGDEKRMTHHSKNNLNKSQLYEDSIVQKRRQQFYTYVANLN